MTSQLTTQGEAFASVRTMLARPDIQAQIRDVLPQHITPEKLAALALTQIRANPKLLDCTHMSLLGAVLESSKLGLEIGSMGQCWIVPLRNNKRDCIEANMWIGYRGLIELAYRSKLISSIEAHAVFEGDKFDYQFGTDKFIHHKPSDDADRSKLTHVYSVIETVMDGTLLDVMTHADVEKIRERSRMGNTGAWISDYIPMAIKTVLNRSLKKGPCSTELQRAITLDSQAEIGIPQGLGNEIDVTPKDETMTGEVPYSENVPDGVEQ